MNNNNIDIITLEVFAERMGVGETTVWKWIRTGKLMPGVHFIKLDRVIRFEWGSELIRKLHEISAPSEPSLVEQPEFEPFRKTRRSRQSIKNRINFDI